MKRVLCCFFLVLVMIIAVMISPAYGINYENTAFPDMPKNWSATALERAVRNGLITGYNGQIQPNGILTRAEFATVINRAFGAKQKASIENYADVPVNAWYYDEMAKAVCMKTIVGTGDGNLDPEKPITREEVFLALANVLKLSSTNTNGLDIFSDNQLTSSWAKDATSALVNAGYVKGSEGLLKPQGLMTRAELAQLLDNIVKQYICNEGIYSTDLAGNVMINVPNVTLKDMAITGDLIIGDGVGDGDVTLDSVVVSGRTVVRGGGINSIRIIGNSHLETVVISRVNGEIRVYSENGTQIGDVIIDGSNDVIVEGTIGRLIIQSSNVTVNVNNAHVKTVTINGDNSNITVNEKSEIGECLIYSSHVTVGGTGKVGIVNANGSYITVKTPQTTVIAGPSSSNIFAGDYQIAPNMTATIPAVQSYYYDPIMITAVDVTGYNSVGSVLTANLTPSDATALYKWKKSDTADGTYIDIIGATSKSFTLTAAEEGQYIKVSATGTGSYLGTVTSIPSQAVVLARIEGSSIPYVYTGAGYTETSNTINLFDTKYTEATICENLLNWTIDTGTTNLTVSSITRDSDQTATIHYSLKVAGQGTGVGTISIKANAAAVETNTDTNAISIHIVAPTYSVTLGTLTRETGDTQSSVSISAASAVEGSQVTLTVNPKSGVQLKPNTLKASYNDGALKEAVLSGSGPYTFTMPAYPITVTAEFEYIYTNVKFTSIGAEVNGYGMDSAHGSADVPNLEVFFLGVTPGGTGYFKVYDTGGSQPGISGGAPNFQAYLKISTLYDPYNFSLKQFKVYNPTDSNVTIWIKGWDYDSPHPPTTDGCVEKIAVKNAWTTIELTGFDGISTLTIAFDDNTALYFNEFIIRRY